MNLFPYYKLRTWITCASYALLNVSDKNDIDIIDLENSTGVTFGIASYGDDFQYTRMLTPFRTFWEGKNTVEKVWGISIENFRFYKKEEVCSMIKSNSVSEFMVGPINMASLYYLPLCKQYKCADHYVSIKKIKNDTYLLTDSEGIPCMKISENDLYNILDISDIPEADGFFNIGIVRNSGHRLKKEQRLQEILELAKNNFFQAEQNKQGGYAFIKCQDIMKNIPASKWKTSLKYDLSYYIQRKYMFLKIYDDCSYLKPEFKYHLEKQIKETAKVYDLISKNEITKALEVMKILSESETLISLKWKEWTSL